MSVLDLLPGGKGPDSEASMEAEAAKLATEMGEAANPVDPYAGTELSRENMGREAPDKVPTAPTEQAPATETTEATGDEPADATGHTIPKGRLDAEIAKRRAVEDREREQARLYHELQGRMNAIQDALRAANQQQQQPQEPDVPPDIETDPIGALKYEQRKRAELERFLQHQQSLEQQKAAEAQMWAWASSRENEFRQKTSNYDDAVKFVINQRQAELRALGVQDQFLPQAIAHETRQLVLAAAQSNRSPAEMVYEMARAKGFGVAQATAMAQQPAVQVAQAAASAPLQLAQPAAPNKAAAAVNLPSSGIPSKGRLTVQQAVDGTDADFDKLWQEMENDSRGRKRKPLWDRSAKRAG